MKFKPIRIKRVFGVSKRTLFDAWSKPKTLSRWLFGGQWEEGCCTVENQFVVNGTYTIIMHFKNTGDSVIRGVYKTINRYTSLSFTWSNSGVKDSLVKLTFKSLSSNRTELLLEHDLFPSASMRDLHNEGWNRCLDNLEAELEPPRAK